MDSLIVALLGIAFLIMYLFDKDITLRFIWLLAGIGLVSLSAFTNQVLISTNATTYQGNTLTIYNYGADNTLNPIGQGLGVLWIFTICIFIWRIIQVYRGEYDRNQR